MLIKSVTSGTEENDKISQKIGFKLLNIIVVMLNYKKNEPKRLFGLILTHHASIGSLSGIFTSRGR